MNNESQKPNKVLLIVRDGWGYSADTEFNMIAQADTPYTDYLEENYPRTLLKASGEVVGLPIGYFGNSEVGHMTIGAGRALEQSLLRINKSINDKSFFENKEFLKAFDFAKRNNSKLHVIGLLQKEGVHAHFDHLVALMELAREQGMRKDDLCIHVITDGRDSDEQHAVRYIADLEQEIIRTGIGDIVSLSGRYYAMDRNNNWERISEYYKTLCPSEQNKSIENNTFHNPQEYLREKYQNSEFSDEFLKPILHKDFSGIQNNDAVIFYNFRKDRARQLTEVFVEDDFSEFTTHHDNIHFTVMTEYYEKLPYVVFSDIVVENILGKMLDENNKTQLRISETEKYAHVTYFFDGGEDYDFNGENKILIDSSHVATFDEKPEMASGEITEKLITEIENNQQDFILCNFPNADMVGHTGEHEAIKKGIIAVDNSLKQIIPKALDNGYVVIVTADHGNAEYKHAEHETSHTDNLVPCILVSDHQEYKKITLKDNMSLENILATVLEILKIQKKEEHKEPLFLITN